jgi:predicted negative regulator of RcsB-dependent stress response
MNEDEARKCFEIAKNAVKSQQFDKAEKFLNKSIKLHDNSEAQVLLQRLDFLRSNAAT